MPTPHPPETTPLRGIQRYDLLAAVYAASPDMILVLDAQGHILDANAQAEQRIGLSAQALCALPGVASLIANDVSPEKIRATLDAAAQGEPQSTEWNICTQAGPMIPVETRLREIPHALPGGHAMLIAVLRDLSELKRSEAQRNQADSRFHALVEQSLAGIYIIQDGTFRYCNPLFATMFGYDRPEELIECTTVPDLVAPEDRQKVTNNIRQRLESGIPELRYAFIGMRKNGERFDVEVHGRTIDYDGRRAVIGVVVDITEQKRAERRMQQMNEELEMRVNERTAALKASNDDLRRAMNYLVQSEKLAALGSLVAGVAHELNTPLGNVLSTASSLQDFSHEFQQQLEHPENLRRSAVVNYAANCLSASELIVRNAERAANLITNFKQVAVDQTSMQRRQFKLHDILNEATLLLSTRIRRAGHEIALEIPADIEMDSHPGALDQIVSNLVINSLNHAFTDGQTGKITLHASCQHDMVTLTYADDGAGMSKNVADHAFEPFFTTHLGSGGSGLGLYTVYNLATAVLGGSIVLDTAPGEGTRLSFHFPQHTPNASAGSHDAHSHHGPAHPD